MRTRFLWAMLLFGVMAYSQTNVSGTVVDKADNQPVIGATIVIEGTSTGAAADFDGKFSLDTSLQPPFNIVVSNIGYTRTVIEITGPTSDLVIELEQSFTNLDEVVIGASRTPERIFESPVSVERFGLREIKNTTAESFYGGLQNLKGVDINTNSLTFQSINTRGFATFANNRFLQLVDGMDNSAPGLNFVLGNLVGMSELEVQSVEIVPGAASALYGAGAFNGILFMRSKSPFDFQGVSAYAKAGLTGSDASGDNGYYDFGFRIAHAFSDKFAVKFNISYLTGEDWHAVSDEDLASPGRTRTDPAYDGLNIYGDEVGTLLNFDAAAGLPSGTVGSAFITRTGYAESDLVDYDAESLKMDLSLVYRPWADDFEIIYNGRRGSGNTIYQGASRYSVSDFTLSQHKLEFRNNNFFVRGYIVSEDAGDSYDSRFTGININRRWKSDVQWFTDYATTFIGARLGVGTGVMLPEDQAHAAARAAADTGRLLPGTEEFNNAFDVVTADGDLTTGSRFIDETQFKHIDANYNFSHLMSEIFDLQLGGSYRNYKLNSSGTIFTDTDGPIKYNEFGAYMQIQKKFADDHFKFTGSLRYDKNEFFDGFLSPRLSLLYNFGSTRNQNLRVSYQQGFRNPTTQDLFIGLNIGSRVLVGSAPDNLNRDVRNFPLSLPGQTIVGSEQVTIVGRAAYENAFTKSSVDAGNPESVITPIIKPEEISAWEAGYRAQFGRVAIDISGYYNKYKNFISNTIVVVPFYGQAGDAESLQAVQNGDTFDYQTYTNSEADIESYGVVAGVDARIFGNFNIGASYTYTDFDFDQAAFPDFRTNFNTAEHKFKASFGNPELFTNFGFNINYRWSDSYFWEATFGDGFIDAYSVLDLQVNYSLPSWKSIIKAGGSNILGEEYFSAIGTGAVGSIFYLSWTYNP